MTRRLGWLLDWFPTWPGERDDVSAYERAYGSVHTVARVSYAQELVGSPERWTWNIVAPNVPGVTGGLSGTADAARAASEAAWFAWKAKCEAESRIPFHESHACGYLDHDTGLWVGPTHRETREDWMVMQGLVK